MKTLKQTLPIFFALLIGALAASFSLTSAEPMDEGDPNKNFAFEAGLNPEEFAETSHSTYFQHGKWTIQILDRVEPFAADAYHFGSSYEERRIRYCNIFFGSMPLGRAEGPYFGTLRIPEVEGLKASVRAKDIKNPKKSIPLYDLMGDGTLCLIVETSLDLVRGSWTDYEVIRLSESKEPNNPAASKARSLFSDRGKWTIPEFKDLDNDGCFEIVDPLTTGMDASTCTANEGYGMLSTVRKWDEEKAEYVLADPTLLFAPENKDGGYKSSTIEERRLRAKKFCEKLAEEATNPGATEKWQGWDWWSDVTDIFVELTFRGHPEIFAKLYDEHCPDLVIGKRWTPEGLSKKELWDELVSESMNERNRFKKWLPQIMKLKTSSEANSETPWKK